MYVIASVVVVPNIWAKYTWHILMEKMPMPLLDNNVPTSYHDGVSIVYCWRIPPRKPMNYIIPVLEAKIAVVCAVQDIPSHQNRERHGLPA